MSENERKCAQLSSLTPCIFKQSNFPVMKTLLSSIGLLLAAVLQLAVVGTPLAETALEIEQQRIATAAVLGQLDKSDHIDPDYLYGVYNDFCLAHFGAELEPLTYRMWGDTLEILPAGTYARSSENSAILGWETNLPARTYVEYGRTTSYGNRTPSSERFFYIHVHYLKNLNANSSYHYRLVAEDERGNIIRSQDRVITTPTIPDAIYIPGTLAGPPYQLTTPDKTYVLTEDIVADGSAIEVNTEGITIDLNGYTITYANGPETQAVGISRSNSSLGDGLRIYNGTIRQGNNPNLRTNEDSTAFAAFYISDSGSASWEDTSYAEIAGVTVEYYGQQAPGSRIRYARKQYNIHHNVFIDKGYQITNRHSSANRPLLIENSNDRENYIHLHHNLIKRTRQWGFGHAQENSHNEIYVDSWSTNSFALQPVSRVGVDGGELHHNRVFTTGYNPYGVGWSHENFNFHHNFIHMEGIDTGVHRYFENWGDQDMSAALRITNYSPGGQVRDNLKYYNNILVLWGRDGAELRGIQFFTDNTITNVEVSDTVVSVNARDDATSQIACVVTHGYYAKQDSHPILYRNSELISNVCNVRFGDAYGKGLNHHFHNVRLIKQGSRPDYHTFVADGGYWTYGHIFRDCLFENGASYEDMFWKRCATITSYSTEYSLTVNSNPGNLIRIFDTHSTEVFSRSIDNSGSITVPLTHEYIRPVNWTPQDSIDNTRAATQSGHQNLNYTPHTVSAYNGSGILLDTAAVYMSQKRTITLPPSGNTPQEPRNLRTLPY